MTSPIYSFPDFKEPEKTSNWSETERPKFVLRDVDKEKAEKRSSLIKARMSPPGALRLPPLLEAQRLKYGITDGFFKSQAAFDRIYVFPIDQFEGEETYGGSSILRTQVTKMRDMQEGHRGILISVGLTAADRLMSHGIEIGHIVTTNKNVPFARRCERLEDFEMFYLVMRDADLAGSETLADEIRAGLRQVVEVGSDNGYCHQVAVVGEDGIIDDIRKKQSVYIQDAW